MTEATKRYVQRLEEKLLAETSRHQAVETSLRESLEISLRAKEQEVQSLETEAQKSWALLNHMMHILKQSKETMKAREELVVAQAAKLKQGEKEVTDYKENIASTVQGPA